MYSVPTHKYKRSIRRGGVVVNTTDGGVGQFHNYIDAFTTVSQPDIYVFHTVSMVFYPHWGHYE
jgi:hypothetical protein